MDQKLSSNRGGSLTALAAVHVISALVAGVFSADAPTTSSAIFLAIVFCQTSLVARQSACSSR